MTNHSTFLCTPAHMDTSPTLKGSWSHVHRGLSLYAHLASHGNLEPSPLEFFTQGFTPPGKGPGGGSAAQRMERKRMERMQRKRMERMQRRRAS